VLLFRKVTRIQTLILKYGHQERLDGAIKDALYVYRFWNSVYGPFIKDCIANHDQLPARIQSWYICLTGHWHLAVLLLADLIQTLGGQLGLDSRQRLVSALRQSSTRGVASLARCSCPREDASFPDADFHFAVNQGAILTEPWTEVLIRVFSKAGALLLEEAAKSVHGNDSTDSLQRCEECVEALWYLGRKSDMAFLTAKVLSKALKSQMNGMAEAKRSQGPKDWFEPEFSLDDDFSFSVPSSESDDSFHGVGDTDFQSLVEDDNFEMFL
jgi:hypothetical protein